MKFFIERPFFPIIAWAIEGIDMKIIRHIAFGHNIISFIGTNKGNNIVAESDVSDNFHVYACEWLPDKITIELDGKPYFTFNRPSNDWKEWPFDKKFHILLNIAIGGAWGGQQGIDTSIFPQRMEEEAIKGLYSGKPLTGEKGIFAPMLKHFLEQSLQGEMDAHLVSERSLGNSNRRNGISTKRVKSSAGEFELQTPRDRLVSFEPSIVAKRQVVLTDQLEGQIISMYGRGMSYSDIGKHIQEIYGYSLSPSEISNITDKVLPMLREWQVRPLSNIYVVAWLDAMYYKGKKEILGIYLTESEG
eukprot:gene31670-42230_t